MEFEYAIQILKEEIFRLNNSEPMAFTFKEFLKLDDCVDELGEAVKMLEEGRSNGNDFRNKKV